MHLGASPRHDLCSIGDSKAARNSSIHTVKHTSKLQMNGFSGSGAIHMPEDIEGDIE